MIAAVFIFSTGVSAKTLNNPNVSKDMEEWKHVQAEEQLGDNQEVNTEDESQTQTGNKRLTDEQIKELESLAMELLEKRKQMLDKYVEFGLLPSEKADKIKERMDDHFQKMKDANFMPVWEKHKRSKEH